MNGRIVGVLAAGAAWAAACGPSSTGTAITVTEGVVDGSPVAVMLDPNQGGKAASLRIEEIRWGRLVDVYDSVDHDGNPLTPELRSLRRRDFLVAETVISDGASYALETNPFTEQTELTILADADGEDPIPGTLETGAERFERLLLEATVNLGFVPATGLGTGWLPPFPLVPRNAALSIRFNDLLDPATISSATVRVLTGAPPVEPFAPRVVADPNYGVLEDTGGALAFRPTRVLVDFAVSVADAAGTSAAVNSAGLPSGTSNVLLNAVVRIPTKLDPATGQFQLLRNPSGHALSSAGNAPFEPNPTRDVVRAFRSGRSDDDVTNVDPNNGFLLDIDPPRILGAQAIALASAPVRLAPEAQEGDAADDAVYLVDLDFAVDGCAQAPRRGDVLRMLEPGGTTLFAGVTRQAAPPAGGVVRDVRVRLLRVPAGTDPELLAARFEASVQGAFESVFRPGAGAIPECYLQVSPSPLQAPADGVDLRPTLSLRFSEAMDPASVTPHDNFRLNRVPGGSPGPLPHDVVVGRIAATPDLREFGWSPLAPLDHALGGAEEYFANLVGGARGMTDLAGNQLADALPPDLRLTLEPSLPTARSGGFVLNFDEVDEDKNSGGGAPKPEVRGQFSYDFVRGVLRPRPVTRDARPVDRTVPIVSVMTKTAGPVITPLVPLGSRMMTVWRYADVGFQVLDETTANVDVEGISWAPFSGAASTDFFDLFEMSLSHSSRLPDEFPIPLSASSGGFAMYPNSGLDVMFDKNPLNDPDNAVRIVHPRDRGYLVTPSQVFTSTTGTRLMPYPMNRGIPQEEFRHYTWRDTAILGRGGIQKALGADLHALATVGALCDTGIPTVYAGNELRSLALPLLMEFKCFSDDAAVGLNGLDTSFALASERLPAFRVFSSGGFDPMNLPIKQNAEAAKATGGFAQGGAKTPGDDNTVMIGQLDLVVRVSRAHTVWFDTSGGLGALGPSDFLDPVLEPRRDDLPVGTDLLVAFRGASDVKGADAGDARAYDAYGDPLTVRIVAGPACPDALVRDSDMANGFVETVADVVPTFFGGDATWHASLKDLDGARFLQARITFVSNAANGVTPELSTLGIAYLQ